MALFAVFVTFYHKIPWPFPALANPSLLVPGIRRTMSAPIHQLAWNCVRPLPFAKVVQVATPFDKVTVKIFPLQVDFSFGIVGNFVLGEASHSALMEAK